MEIKLTDDQLLAYFRGQIHHRAYRETTDLYENIRIHADGVVPEKLIKARRPSESEETFTYRKTIYVPKTKNPIGKVVSSLSKIRRSPDWKIDYGKAKVPARVVDGERLQDYCEVNYPGHKSITNWLFSVLLKTQCVDANAVVAVLPINPTAGQTEYLKPMAIIFNSPQVLFFEEGAEYAVLQSSERSSLVQPDASGNYAGACRVFYVITTELYQKWEETSLGSFQMTQDLKHNTGKLPVFKIRAQFLKQKENTIVQESRLAPMLPSLDEAAREYSDLQAAKVQHMFPLFWYYQSQACATCRGFGKIPSESGEKACTSCSGNGRVKFSPYAHMEVEPIKMGDLQFPFNEPAGYVTRDTKIIELQSQGVKDHLFDALASINMQFLDQTPLNISGEAKNVDREELNNFVYSVAEDLVHTMDSVYWWICEWRYSVLVPTVAERAAMLPKIAVPEQFDLLPADYLMDSVSKARLAKINPVLLAAMEQEYALKKFYNNPELSLLIQNYFELDPLPGLTVDEKNALLMNHGVTKEQFVISANVVSFVRRASSEDETFFNKPLSDREAKMKEYATIIVTETDAAEQVKQQALLATQQANAFNKFPGGN